MPIDPFSGAADIAAAIRARRVSSLEVTDLYLARIAKHNPALNAVVTLDEEGARKRAREADEALARGELWGPMHGLPMTLKGGHAAAGMRPQAGYQALGDCGPEEDGTVSRRDRSAGAIC